LAPFRFFSDASEALLVIVAPATLTKNGLGVLDGADWHIRLATAFSPSQRRW
jgi:hypothetical protein